jgi:exopolysaccharide production protein ExoQ
MALQPAGAAFPFAAAPAARSAAAPAPLSLPPPALTGVLVAVSLTCMVLTGYVGTVAAIGFLAGWVLLAAAYAPAAAQLLLRGPAVVWLLPGFGLLSVLWSQAPAPSLRYALEFAATIGCAVLSARLLTPRAHMVALTAALIATSAVSLLLGHQFIGGQTGVSAFAGVFGSKNQLGFFASLLVLASLGLLLDRRQPGALRLLGVGAALLSLLLLAMAHSATSLGSVAIGGVVLLLGVPLARLDRFGRARVLFVGGVVLGLCGLPLLLSGAHGESLVLGILGRDDTLTGRTILWRYAAQIIPDHPWLGRGFNAFWLRDNPDAEALWAAFHLPGRTGFTFHNAYVAAAVELGYVGVALTAATFLVSLVGTIRWSWQERSVPAAFHVAVVCCLLARSIAEVDILLPFDLGAFMLCVAATYAAQRGRGGAPA